MFPYGESVVTYWGVVMIQGSIVSRVWVFNVRCVGWLTFSRRKPPPPPYESFVESVTLRVTRERSELMWLHVLVTRNGNMYW